MQVWRVKGHVEGAQVGLDAGVGWWGGWLWLDVQGWEPAVKCMEVCATV